MFDVHSADDIILHWVVVNPHWDFSSITKRRQSRQIVHVPRDNGHRLSHSVVRVVEWIVLLCVYPLRMVHNDRSLVNVNVVFPIVCKIDRAHDILHISLSLHEPTNIKKGIEYIKYVLVNGTRVHSRMEAYSSLNILQQDVHYIVHTAVLEFSQNQMVHHP